ncbi:MAG TPA: penicillin-binding transpeptidase domain-containing protein [Gammaproteobacteria bacterium]|jgi:cell division protein FtsI (penicillin-binding protein 3)|nr:penicillin-binding transpeptidase domain-containing protein [Gammaproteobacteria bacterium]
MMNKNQPTFMTWRFYAVLIFISMIVLGLAGRVFYLAVLNQHFLRHQGDERVLRLVSTHGFRGMIVDRNGFPLAVSTAVYSVWVNPQEFVSVQNNAVALARLLDLKPKEITETVVRYQKKKREFVYLKRSLSPEIANKVKMLKMPGVYLQQEYRRYYPEGEVAGHIVGFTNVDDQGQEGLELGYNQWLLGEAGEKWVIKDRLGRVISDVQTIQDQKPGHDLVLSIDRRIQYLAYRELLAGVMQNHAVSGSAIVLDAKTGEILAMVNQPSFNPNNRKGVKSDNFRNRAVTDLFEPGSTMKAFSVATALASGKFKPDTIIDTYPGWLRVGRNIVKDEHEKGPMTVTRIMQISSNVGVTKMILSLPPDQLWELLHHVGFSQPTGIGFPGEQNGVLVRHSPWGAFTLATLAFGYGVSVTPLQLASAYAVFANGGEKIPVSLLKLDTPPTRERVMDPRIAQQMLLLLESVVTKGGTGELASVPGYRVAGKTGTAVIASDHGGYEKHRYISSFVGIAPLSNPRIVVAVVIRDPRGKNYYGGQVSGPVFEKIMESTLRLLDVSPDAPPTTDPSEKV